MPDVSPGNALVRRDIHQPNLIDGSIYCFDIRHNGAYVTVAGNAETPLILSFDLEDIQALRHVVNQFDLRVPPP